MPPSEAQGRSVVIFDCESDGVPANQESKGPHAFENVHCTCACALVVRVPPGTSFEAAVPNAQELVQWCDDEDSAPPFERLFRAFDDASVVVGYNVLDFDFPLLFKHYQGKRGRRRYMEHRCKTHDPFSRIRAATGVWASLQSLLNSNDVPSKSATGADAVRWWKCGDRASIQSYCLDDVRRTVDVLLKPNLLLLPPGVNSRTSPNAIPLPHHVYGIAPALRSTNTSDEVDGVALSPRAPPPP